MDITFSGKFILVRKYLKVILFHQAFQKSYKFYALLLQFPVFFMIKFIKVASAL